MWTAYARFTTGSVNIGAGPVSHACRALARAHAEPRYPISYSEIEGGAESDGDLGNPPDIERPARRGPARSTEHGSTHRDVQGRVPERSPRLAPMIDRSDGTPEIRL